MPSRRALLGGLATGLTTGLAGCANLPAVAVPRIDDQPCPPLDVHADRTVCSHTDEKGGDDRGSATGGVSVSASPTTVGRSSESLEQVTFRIDNRTDSPLKFDGSRWRAYRNAGFGWHERQISVNAFDDHTVEPGGAVSWHGIDAWLELASDEQAKAGLYAAVLPTYVANERVVAAFLFRVVRG